MDEKKKEYGASAKKSKGRSGTHAASSSKAQAKDKEREIRKAAKAQEKARREEQRVYKTMARREAHLKAMKKLKTASLVLGLLAVVLVAGAAVWGRQVTMGQVNFPKMYISGIPVGGLSYDQTLAALEDQEWDKTVSEPLIVQLPANVSFQVDLCKSGAMLTKEDAASAALRYGHESNWFVNLFTYLINHIAPVDISDEARHLDEAYIRGCAQEGIEKFKEATDAGNSYQVDREKGLLHMIKGAGELSIDLDMLCQEISTALENNQRHMVHEDIDNQLMMPDFEGIYTHLAIEPQDAYFEEDTFEVVDEIVGYSFDVDEAKSIWQAARPGDEVDIKVEIIQPSVTGEYLRSLLYRDLLGSRTTCYNSSIDNRVNNIERASASINEYILFPGEVFSYNNTVGERTLESGYLMADAYSNGEVVQTVGGGICQVSSTLYYATVMANLETVERTNHYFKVSYMGYGEDATVNWGSLDFRFRNNRDYPVKIVVHNDRTYCEDHGANNHRTLTIEIWGTDVDGSYVELQVSRYYGETDEGKVYFNVYGKRNVYDADGNLLYQLDEPAGTYFEH